jgi:hypothetical protein
MSTLKISLRSSGSSSRTSWTSFSRNVYYRSKRIEAASRT